MSIGSIFGAATSICQSSMDYLSGPVIKVCVEHCLSEDEVKTRLINKANSYQPEFVPNYQWEANICTFSGSAEGTITIDENELRIEMRLSPLYGFFQARLQAELATQLKRLLE